MLPLDRYLLWLCRRGGRPGPQCSPAPSRPPMGPPRPAGTDPPIGPPPNPPRSLRPPKRPPGSRGSESGVSPSVVNGRSSNNKCHSYKDVGIGQGRRQVRVWRKGIFRQKVGWVGRAGNTKGKERKPTCNGKMKDKGQEKGERRMQGRKKTKLIKTHKMFAINPLCPLPHPVLPKIPQISSYLCKLCGCVIYPVSATL